MASGKEAWLNNRATAASADINRSDWELLLDLGIVRTKFKNLRGGGSERREVDDEKGGRRRWGMAEVVRVAAVETELSVMQ
ncbi:hypothetical protein Scep_006471 [Stephania cephalantha]|uniref:Uncharacterized protein n=1 Tax=Stephania cephalantha TaxID=152367 RepID=A0AAP0PM92_9MAGN